MGTKRILPDGKIEGTWTTIYHVMDYIKENPTALELTKRYPITEEEAQSALDYIAAHQAEVEADYKIILERCERGNPPEIVERLNRSHERALKYREELRARKAQEAARRE